MKCPSDDGTSNQIRSNSYSMCLGGDGTAIGWTQWGGSSINQGRRLSGIFMFRDHTRHADVTDGTSNTLMYSERLVAKQPYPSAAGNPATAALNVRHKETIALVPNVHTNPQLCRTVAVGQFLAIGTQHQGNGGKFWHDGHPTYVAFNTILPPNAPSCVSAISWGDGGPGILPPTSNHPAGVNAVRADGSVGFISETIDTGNLSVPAQNAVGMSPYGVWGALGTKNGGEVNVSL